jgi:hypothetical protein
MTMINSLAKPHHTLPLVPFIVLLVACRDRADKSADYSGVDSATTEDTSPCDGQRGTVYPDADGDGYGVEEGAVEGCIPAVQGFAEEAGDCDDQNSEINPGVKESCLTDWDDNCDGIINAYPPGSHYPRPDGCTNYYLDNDGDGYGQYDDDECMCAPEAPYTAPNVGDCDDDDPTVWRDDDGCIILIESIWTARINGFQEDQSLGFFPTSAEFLIAELTGDGVPDLLIGGPLTKSADGSQGGALFLVPGPLSGDVDLDDTDVYRLEGGASVGVWFFGGTVLVVDLDGDGVDEVITSGQDGEPSLWILDSTRWQTEGLDATVALMQTPTMPFSTFGTNAAASSDLDGDGLVELILGDDGDDQAGKSAGAIYIVENPPAGRYDVNTVTTAKLTGEAKSDWAGTCVADAGDTDGDGLGDVLVGATKAYSGGAAYLLSGPLEGDLSLSDADAIFVSETAGAHGGCGLAGGGDANGDGLDDLLIGAYTAYGEDGAAYLVQGGSHLGGRSLMNAAAEATFVGHEVDFPDAFWTGKDVTFVQGTDDHDALAIGSPGGDDFQLSGGAVTFVVDPEPGVHTIGSVGATLNGTEAPGVLGWSLANSPDIDGDGWGELLIGAPGMSPDGLWAAGSIFLVSGGLLNGLQ